MKLLLPALALASALLLTACSMFDDSFDENGTAYASAPPPAGAAPVPTTPVPQRATGVYNSSTGQIEWRPQDGSPPMPPPAPRKRFWLF